MKEVKFRQPIWNKKKFVGWHYWGFIGGGFIGIVPPIEKAKQEVQQYTGLKDKNEKEIYEGDILIVRELHDSNAFDGVWNNEKQESIPQIIECNSPIDWILPSDISWHPNYWEVIGNIYENPELI
jgi:uncharacterized phage protein (TIGR01671 family)